jgi:hypothetical protein
VDEVGEGAMSYGGHVTSADGSATAVFVEYRAKPGWTFAVTFDRAGRPVGFDIRPDPPGLGDAEAVIDDAGFVWPVPDGAAPVTARLLRDVPLGAMTTFAWQTMSDAVNHDMAARVFPQDLRDRFAQLRTGRAGRSDTDYALLAKRYVELLGSGNASAQLASDLCHGRDTARGLLYEARNRGLLTKPPRPGVEGGELTEKAKRLLMEEA